MLRVKAEMDFGEVSFLHRDQREHINDELQAAIRADWGVEVVYYWARKGSTTLDEYMYMCKLNTIRRN